jgi:small redox-active disulfide protein 2
MKIEVLGAGCEKCHKLYAAVEQAMRFVGIEAELRKVENMEEILRYQVLMTPALVIDGQVKVAGRVPDQAELTTMLTTAALAAS